MNKKIEHRYVEILEFLVDFPQTNYQELAEHLSVSPRTVQRYINELRLVLKELEVDLDLSIQPGVGLTLSGDLAKANHLVNQLKTFQVDEVQDRSVYICLQLLQADKAIPIQQFADDLYVSRSTIENALKQVREKLAEHTIQLNSNNKGLYLEASENQKRALLADILKYFWRGISASPGKHEPQWAFNVVFSEQAKRMIQPDTIDKVIQVVHQLIEKMQLQITDYEYQSLILHLTIAIERIRLNQYIESERSEPVELLPAAKFLIDLLEESFNVVIYEGERNYINQFMKIFEQNDDYSSNDPATVTFEHEQELRTILKRTLGDLKPDDTLYNHLIQHLNSAVNRLKLEASIRNPYLDEIKKSFSRAFALGVTLAEELEKHYDIQVGEDEIAYIAIHIQSFLERREEDKQEVILVCASGFGTAKLLEQRLLQNFDELITIKKIAGIRELNALNINDELVISTISIELPSDQVIVVNPLLSEQDLLQVRKYLTDDEESLAEKFWSLVEEEFVFISKGEKETKEAVLTTITTRLIQKGYAKIGILESAHAREELASTAMRDFAMPHGETKFIEQTIISIYINPNGIQWGDERVNFVFFFAINPDDAPHLKEIYKYFNYLIDQPTLLKEMLETTNSKELIERMKGNE